ncbi:hypothetical protein BRYFOR_05580 [Marvinbryantia formatexigens DSM 14469]|uniref:Uncharacterized protein n=1 Tax=Marvinbryantia formatexigens DSM 14469 TaxID=478749 RepID=C6LAD8_9FIRM|nr:hypothetical protein [Marvinbryantia formatexigens]EET62545.1 hypothetical protein BRYFOR_05580 [Marvinbryantia formatexigens DSM 14469]UWO24934.1 hypothetical protein NQ534_00090 [Marvinbryantia formatexigens DSM 14469]SDG24361.1 hypothetical protein SAMN05660368_02161 [Marvinbryantia formatexigens]
MVHFELKKVFAKRSSQIALLLLLVFVLYLARLQISYMVWINEDGTELTGKAAAEKFREEAGRWYGPLSEEKIAEVISQGYHQGNREIRMLLTWSFGGFRNTDSAVTDSLVPEDAVSFYDNRVKNLQKWLQEMGTWYTDGEKEFMIARYEAMETPLAYQYANGWQKAASGASGVQMFLLLVTGFLVSGIFSEEYRTGASAVFFSTALGRNRATAAKIKAGLLLITTVYWSGFALYSVPVFMELGTGGADCMI